MTDNHAGAIGGPALNDDEHEKTYRLFLRLIVSAASVVVGVLIILAIIAG